MRPYVYELFYFKKENDYFYLIYISERRKIMRNEIILFDNQNVKLEVNLKDDTVWLTQAQMATLFGKDRKTITRHIQNIYKDGELEEK